MVRLAIFLLASAVALHAQGLRGGADADPSNGRLRIETVVPEASVHVGEAFVVVVRVSVDREWLRAGLVQPYVRPIDVPLHLEAGWIGTDARFKSEEMSPKDEAGRSRRRRIALNGVEADAFERDDAMFEGRRFAVWEVLRRMSATRAGEVSLSGVVVRFAESRGFRTDFLGNRIAEDRFDGSVMGDPASIVVVPLPTAGRPAGFGGVIGDYRIVEAVATAVPEAPRRWIVDAVVVGNGNLSFIPTLRFDAIPGWRTLGVLDPGGAAPRRLRLDLESIGEIEQSPNLALATFDPSVKEGWTTVRSAVTPPPGAVRGPRPIPLREARRVGFTFDEFAWRAGLVLPWIAMVVAWRLLRDRDRDRKDPLGARARRAASEFRTSIRRGTKPRSALSAYVAARLRCTEDALVDRRLNERLESLGLSEEDARELGGRLRSDVDGRYGASPSPELAHEAAVAWVTRVEAAVRTRGERP